MASYHRLCGDMAQHLDLFLGTENTVAAYGIQSGGGGESFRKGEATVLVTLFPVLYMVLKSLPSTPGKE